MTNCKFSILHPSSKFKIYNMVLIQRATMLDYRTLGLSNCWTIATHLRARSSLLIGQQAPQGHSSENSYMGHTTAINTPIFNYTVFLIYLVEIGTSFLLIIFFMFCFLFKGVRDCKQKALKHAYYAHVNIFKC